MALVIDKKETGHNIWNLREAKGLSASELAEFMEFSVNNIYKWQNGQTLPTLDNLVALSGILEISINEIIVVREEQT